MENAEVLYDRDKTIYAWHQFIETGTIPEGCVRAPVAASWQRCRTLGVDPFSTSYPRMSRSRLQRVQEENARLLSYAIPCLRLLQCVAGSGGSAISSPELFTYYMVSEYESDPQSYGIVLDERTCGNTAISLASIAGDTSFLHKYEKFRLVDQSSSSAAAPVRLDGALAGFLSHNSLGGISMDQMCAMVDSAAALLGRLAAGCESAEAMALLQELIGLAHRPIFLLDSEGRITAANADCARFISVTNEDGSPARLSDSLVAPEDIACFTVDGDDQQRRSCGLRTIYQNTFLCEILSKERIVIPGLPHMVAVALRISTPGRQVWAAAHPVLPSLPDRSENVEYVGASPAWARIDAIIRKVAKFPSSVLLQGESGTGKEVVARTIHNLSGRSGKFVAINCGDIPDGLLQSELFGYEKGAFTGANREGSIGKFEYADGGTILLDEIGDMPLPMQVSLLRFIQERTVQRVGSNRTRQVDVRIIAATNKNIEQLVKEQRFRDDLYYRLNIVGFTLPPLRDRKEDIPALTQYFLKNLSRQYGLPLPVVEPDVYRVLMRYDWPGNVRELRNVAEKLLIMTEREPITVQAVYRYIFDYDSFNNAPRVVRSEVSEKEKIQRTLSAYRGNVSKTAAELGMARDTLYRKMKKYGLQPEKG